MFPLLVYLPSESVTVHCTSRHAHFFLDYFIRQKFIPRYTGQIFAWSLQSRSHDSCSWPLDVRRDSDCPHTSHLSASPAWTSRGNTVSTNAYVDKYWLFLSLVLHLATVGATRTGGRYLYKCTAPTMWQILKCLSDARRDSAAVDALVKLHRWSIQ